MKFVDFINREAIRTQVEADAKDDVIRGMAGSLREAGKIGDEQFESIVEAILKREELGSTGIGRGVAVPHTKHPSVGELVGAVAVSEEGVDFDSLDGEKVHLLFLLVSPPDRPGDHLRALENISVEKLAEYCQYLDPDADVQIASTYCLAYVHGFIDGAVATDPRVSENVAMEIERDKLRDRAVRTRIKQRLERYGPSYFAGFCIPQPVPLQNIVDLIKAELKTDANSASARELVYNVVRKNYPCSNGG